MLTKIKVDKIDCGEGAISSRVKVAHLKVTFDEGGNGCQEFNFRTTGMYLRVKGDHDTNDLTFLMNELKKESKVAINHFKHNRRGTLNFNESEEETMTSLEGKICQYASQVIKAHDFINEEKTLTYKVTAKKRTIK